MKNNQVTELNLSEMTSTNGGFGIPSYEDVKNLWKDIIVGYEYCYKKAKQESLNNH